jgi:hypothetical protein
MCRSWSATIRKNGSVGSESSASGIPAAYPVPQRAVYIPMIKDIGLNRFAVI